MVPIFEAFIYPALKNVVNITPLRKMAAGGILAALAFVMAGLLQLKVNETLEPKPSAGNVFVQRVGNSSANFTIEGFGDFMEFNKMEVPMQNYTLLGPNDSRMVLNLNKPKSAYVVGIFDRSDGLGSVLLFYLWN